MNPWTCAQVEEQIDLYAAGECDAPDRQAVEQHVQTCEPCAEKLRAAQHLRGLLDLHFREEEQLQRLRSRLEVEQHKLPFKKPGLVPFLRKAAALAAMLLVVVGLFQWLGTNSRWDRGGTGGSPLARGPDTGVWDIPDGKQL